MYSLSQEAGAQYLTSIHSLNGVKCADCHTDIHVLQPWKGDKRKVVSLCIRCHDAQSVYRKSIHGQAVLVGNQDAAACNDCHGLHQIAQLGNPKSFTNRKFHTMVCSKCHANKEMMERNGVMTVAIKTYFESYHGKNYRLGFPEKVAGCADCHTAHSILPASNPESSVNPGNLVKTCSQCHPRDSRLFTRFYPHADENDPKHYPVIYWTYTAMKVLLTVVFAVFWLHTLLWMSRGFVENREKKIALVEGRYHPIFPNLRDIEDVRGMMRWFLMRGPKPSFERWTYWEKFDFLAVFWGMFVIGGSGFLLWFPTFFSLFLPGWIFNLATIVHSDEALLATGFIFTVHFFNTHGRPEKFPMDFVIFNGEITKEDFVEERGDQWERYENEGITEKAAKPRPSRALYDFTLKSFGFLAVFTGISLIFLMAYTFLASTR